MKWRLLLPNDGAGAYHMAVDAALVESIRAGKSGPVLRFYRWTPACVTLGKFQPAEGNIQLENCRRLGLDVAKRPTGGWAILHDREVTFSMVLAEADLPGAGSGVMDSYRVLGAALVDGLRRLGLPAELVDQKSRLRGGDAGGMAAEGNPACFAAKARCDLMVQERKIIGCAQLRRGGVILQQNSLPLTIDFPLWDEVFYRADWRKVAEEGAVDLCTAAGRMIGEAEVVAALCDGFRAALGAELEVGRLTGEEEVRARALEADYSVLTQSGAVISDQ